MTDTIVAVATAPTPGAVGIVRLSGPRARDIADQACRRSQAATPRYAVRAQVCSSDGQILDEGLLLTFVAPASFTGEDVAELQLHGNPLVLQQVVQRCVALGARRAEPGEFSRRAFLNGKLDLAQAEAIADLISAESAAAARAAQNSLQGVFSRQCVAIADALLTLRVQVEAWLDFPEEDIDPGQCADWVAQLRDLQQQLRDLDKAAEQGQRLTQGMSVLIVGAPNAGKSTLLNALAQREVAIVNAAAGTTRDLLSEHLVVNDVPLKIVDTAGLRAHTDDPIEQEGIRRAHAAASDADQILAIHAHDAPLPSLPPEWQPRLLSVVNKIDQSGETAGLRNGQCFVSAKTQQGLDQLASALVGRQSHSEEGAFSARQRHRDDLREAMFHVDHSVTLLHNADTLELAAEQLRRGQDAVGRITGEVHAEDLLGRIFAGFCIGK